jgi:hypothetical protein
MSPLAANPEFPNPLQLELDEETGDSKRRWAIRIAVALFVLLLHGILLFFVPVGWLGNESSSHPRVPLTMVDANKLAKIREQWANNKRLLLNKNKSLTPDTEAPKDARYMSDRNIKVEKEQQARKTNVIPKAGSEARPGEKTTKQGAEKETKASGKFKGYPSLGNLGIPFRLSPNPKPLTPEHKGYTRSASEEGGDQALDEKNLPVGSENLLNAQESIYYSFYARLYEAIGPLWQSEIRRIPFSRKIGPGDYSTVVDVVLDKQGNLLRVERIQSSNIPEFDQAVDVSWKKVGKFQNPPSGLLDAQGEVHTGWTFTVQVGQAGIGLNYLPPERNY